MLCTANHDRAYQNCAGALGRCGPWQGCAWVGRYTGGRNPELADPDDDIERNCPADGHQCCSAIQRPMVLAGCYRHPIQVHLWIPDAPIVLDLWQDQRERHPSSPSPRTSEGCHPRESMKTKPILYNDSRPAEPIAIPAGVAHRIGARLLHEFREVLPPTIFFVVGFNFVVFTTNLLVAEYDVASVTSCWLRWRRSSSASRCWSPAQCRFSAATIGLR